MFVHSDTLSERQGICSADTFYFIISQCHPRGNELKQTSFHSAEVHVCVFVFQLSCEQRAYLMFPLDFLPNDLSPPTFGAYAEEYLWQTNYKYFLGQKHCYICL